jgi:hypothetical protein
MYFSIAAERLERHHYEMGSGSNPSIKPDLFSAQQPPDTSSPSANEPKRPLRKDEPAAAASPSYALPTNLPSALSHLDDDQLDRLLAALICELKQRGRKLPDSDEPLRKRRTKEVAPPLAQGKLNAVRAAFKAGVRPSRIARQFGVSLSDVRKALASDPSR